MEEEKEHKKTSDENPLKVNRRHFFSQLSVGYRLVGLGFAADSRFVQGCQRR